MFLQINLYLTILTLIFLIFLLVVYLSKKNMNNVENKLYKQILLWNFLQVISHMALYYGLINGPKFNAFTIFSLRIYTASTVFILFFLALYLFAVARENPEEFEERYTKEKKKIITYIITFMVVSMLILFIFPYELEFTKDYYNVYGFSIYYMYIIFIAFLLFGIVIICRKRKVTPKKKITPFYMLGVLVVIYFSVIALQPQLCAIIVLTTLVSYLMFHTIENPDMKMIAQLELAKSQAEKSNEAKSDFLSSMSHEIRTPLNAIVGLSQVIAEGDNMENMKSDSKDILIASQNLLEIVNGILDMNKLESNEMEITENTYDPIQEFESILKLIRIRIGAKPIELKTNYANDVPKLLYGDKEKVKQIVSNLLTNAVKYTEKGFIYFNVSCKNNHDKCELIVSVKDTGRGISEEQQLKLFAKFHRQEEDKDSNIAGTGLGLAITKSLVELFDGAISVDSIEGQGSTFTVNLMQKIITKKDNQDNVVENRQTEDSINNVSTVTTTESQELKEATPQENNDNLQSALLVVDDNKINLKVAAKILEDYDYKVDMAHSGFECLEKVQNNKDKYDVIFMDIMMPDMDGVETMKKLKALENFNTPVIALTADSMSGSREKYLASGFDEYVSKPIIKDLLEKALNKCVDLNSIEIVKEEASQEDTEIL